MKKYTENYKEMISALYKSGVTISGISSKYGIVKSTINGW
ncbi:transposase [Clostridium perfringens]